MNRATIITCLTAIAAGPLFVLAAAPHPMNVGSVEVVASSFRTIARGKIVSITIDQQIRCDVRVEVEELLKGKADKYIVVHVGAPAQWQGCMKRGGQVLVCTEDREIEPISEMISGSWGSGGGLQVVQFAPAWVGHGAGLYDLTVNHDLVYSIDWGQLKTPQEVLAAFKTAAKYAPSASTEEQPRVEETDFELFGPTPRGYYAPRLLIPGDMRIVDIAKKCAASPNGRHRLRAVFLLSKYSDSTMLQIVRGLNDDPAYEVYWADLWKPRIEDRVVRHFYVRDAARKEVLTLENTSPISVPHMAYSAPRWRWLSAGIAAVVLLALMFARLVPRRRLGVAGVVVSLAAASVIAFLWWRSGNRVDSATFVAGATEHEITSTGGRVAWLRVEDHASPRTLRLRSEADDSGQWYRRLLAPAVQVGRLGVGVESGRTVGGSGEATYPYHLLDFPYWMALAVFLGWPMIFAGCVAGDRIRRRRRGRTGRCRECGYDLRTAPAGICPECGSGNG